MQTEKYFLAYELKYKAQTVKRISLELPWNSGSIQLRNRLYFCGGLRMREGSRKIVHFFFSVDKEGRKSNLAPLSHPRKSASLSGNSQTLLTSGGYTWDYYTAISELYVIKLDKWKSLPPLN